MLKRIMFGLIVGFYFAEPIESEFAPALAAIIRYLRYLICVLYALPVNDSLAISERNSISTIAIAAKIDGPRHDRTGCSK
jgi:hypothetical protein